MCTLVVHTATRELGGFNWPSQHLDQEVCGWDGQEGGRHRFAARKRTGR